MEAKLTVAGQTIPLSPIVKIAEGAGEVILAIYNAPSENWAVQAKSDSSPLTKADLAANAYICAELKLLHPSIPIMSEETKAAPYTTRATWTLYWCVDPLDGTKEFVKRNGEFTVNIALMHAPEPGAPARPVLGVVHAPVLRETYFAANGFGAHTRAGPIKCKEFSEGDSGLVLVCSRSHLDERTEQFLGKFDKPEKRAVGSSLKFMLVAKGDAHVYPRLAPTMEWDTAASQIIVEEAGGVVLREDNNKPLRYNKEELRNPFFIVYGKRRAENKS